MPSYFVEDFLDAKRNRITVLGSNGGPAYNAVISVKFSEEETNEPIYLDEAKDWLRVDIGDDENLIVRLIKAARIVCENYANLSFKKRKVTARIHNGLGNFYLPYGPVIGDLIVKDTDGNIITGYNINEAYAEDAIVAYNAGYSNNNIAYDILPENFRTAILDQISFMFENRGDAKVASGLSLESMLILQQVRNV